MNTQLAYEYEAAEYPPSADEDCDYAHAVRCIAYYDRYVEFEDLMLSEEGYYAYFNRTNGKGYSGFINIEAADTWEQAVFLAMEYLEGPGTWCEPGTLCPLVGLAYDGPGTRFGSDDDERDDAYASAA